MWRSQRKARLQAGVPTHAPSVRANRAMVRSGMCPTTRDCSSVGSSKMGRARSCAMRPPAARIVVTELAHVTVDRCSLTDKQFNTRESHSVTRPSSLSCTFVIWAAVRQTAQLQCVIVKNASRGGVAFSVCMLHVHAHVHAHAHVRLVYSVLLVGAHTWYPSSP